MIIEDNELIRNEIHNLLDLNKYKTIKIHDFNNITNQVKEYNPDLILLDINLPNDDGFKICTEIRSFSKTPIIFVTSRSTNIDELMGITLGADDFITKPYNTQILLARVASVLKRAYPNEKITDNIEHNGITLNILTNTIQYNDKSVELTKNEFKNYIYNEFNKYHFINDNTLTVNITRIRNKMEELGIKDYIKTKRGQGYMI